MPETEDGLESEGRQRRSHAERSAETRIKIIDAVVSCIAEIGFQRTTASEIANRAGVTWGAVQHHFGGKEGILAAVLEESYSRFEALLDDVDFEDMPVAEAADMFVDRAWQHFTSPIYRSTFQIVINYSFDPDIETDPGQEAGLPEWQVRMLTAWVQVWNRVFPNVVRSEPERNHIAHYCVSVLTGFSATSMLQPAGIGLPPAELDFLKQTLVRELGGDT